MLIKISANKARYDKGQIFPFLIALIVVIIIIAMITLNLGQIGVFKTDMSNAADAAALAGASTLSAYLLGIGLKSDMMCGDMIVSCAAAIILFCFVVTIPAAIAVCIAFLIKQLVTYFQSLEDGKMAWSNAKKSAMQYAFQNAGVDEQRFNFREFLSGVYNISNADSLSPADIAKYYKIYSLGDDPSASSNTRRLIKNYAQSGFSRFMEEAGYWDDNSWGQIKPGNISPAIVTNGYGWDPVTAQNSYASGNSYRNYPNYVEVTVTANVIYPLELYNPITEVWDSIQQWLRDNLSLPWWLSWLEDALVWLVSLAMGILQTTMPGGLQMDPIKSNTDWNPITVTVSRYKKDNNLGLWKFRYGMVQAQATAHAYGEDDGDGVPHDIKPLFFNDLWNSILKILGGAGNWNWAWFDTKKHLFETELTNTR